MPNQIKITSNVDAVYYVHTDCFLNMLQLSMLCALYRQVLQNRQSLSTLIAPAIKLSVEPLLLYGCSDRPIVDRDRGAGGARGGPGLPQ